MVKLISGIAVAVLASGVVALGQDVDRRSKTKITVEDGKDVTLTGCVQRAAEGGFVLAHAAGKDGALGSYVLVGEDADDLDDHLGHRVEVKGKAADKGDGKVKIEARSEVESAAGDKKTRQSRTEVEGDLDGLPFLGVKSIRTIATVCP